MKTNQQIPNYKILKPKLIIILLIFISFIFLSLIQTFNIINNNSYSYKKYIKKEINQYKTDIYDNENNLIAYNSYRYSMFINKKNVDINKINLFFNIIENSINKKIDRNKILSNKKKRILIIKNLTENDISNIKKNYKLLRQIKFLKYFISKNGTKYLYAPEFIKEKKNKHYIKNNQHLQPWLGIYRNNKGEFGIEKILSNDNNKKLKFVKKSANGIWLDNNKTIYNKKINLSINLELNNKIYNLLKNKYKKLEAENILVSVVNSKTGKILSLTQTKNFDTNNILKNDSKNMKNYYNDFYYEAGSVIKPITILAGLDNNIIDDLNEKIDLDKGILKIGKYRIKDIHHENNLSIEDIIVHSSNVGTSKIALRFKKNEFYKNLIKMKLFDKSNFSLAYKKQFIFSNKLIKNLKRNTKIYRATTSYGYGFMITPYKIQELYNIFFNEGKYIEFSIFDNNTNKEYNLFKKKHINMIKKSLIKTVKEGTGKYANLEGLIIGGKTGTSHISIKGKYEKEYNSTFIGFVEDHNGNIYNILVLVSKPLYKYHYASQSAVPIFRDVVKLLLHQNYLNFKIN